MSSLYPMEGEEEAVGFTDAELLQAKAELAQEDADLAAAEEETRIEKEIKRRVELEKAKLAKPQHPVDRMLFGDPKHQAKMAAEKKRKSELGFFEGFKEELFGTDLPVAAPVQAAAVAAPDPAQRTDFAFVPPALRRTDTTPPDLTAPTGGIDYQIAQLRNQQRLTRELAAAEQDLAQGEGFYGLEDDEGKPVKEYYADARARIATDKMAKRDFFRANWDTELVDIKLRADYPGAPVDSVKSWKDVLGEDVRDTGLWQRASLDGKLELEAQERSRKASAKRKLHHASQIDPEGAFPGMVSKMIAAIGLGFGAWAATRRGGPNMALQLYNQLIANDIDAQKANFAKAERGLDRKENEYGRMMARFGDEQSAELGLAVLNYEKGIRVFKDLVQKKKVGMQQAEIGMFIGKLMEKKDAAQTALQKKFMAAQAAEYSGLNDLQGRPIRFTGARLGIEQDLQDKKAIRDELVKATDIKQALDNYVEASRHPDAWAYFGTAKKKAETLKETLIQMSSEFYGMGVLQEFEREVLAAVIPGGGTVKEKLITLFTGADQSRLEAYSEALTKFINDKFYSKLDKFTHYEPWAGPRVKEKKSAKSRPTEAKRQAAKKK